MSIWSGKSAKSTKGHVCEIKEEDPSFAPLAPFARCLQRTWRKIQKYVTVQINSVRTKRYFRNKSSMISEQKRHVSSPYAYILHPLSVFNRIREFVFIVIWGYKILVVPVLATFGLAYFGHYYCNWVLEKKYVVDMFLVYPLEILSVLLMIFTGYSERNSKTIVINQKQIINRYLKTYFIVDFLTIVPVFHDSDSSEILYFVHCACILRIGTFLKYFKRFLLDLGVKEEVYTCIALGILTVYLINIFTCIFLLVPTVMYYKHKRWPWKCWMVTAQIAPVLDHKVQPSVAYLECTLCIVCHFFGVGQGMYEFNDVTHENIVLSLVMITGRLWTLYIIANLLRIFNVVTVSESKYEEYLLQIEVYMRQMKLPMKLRTRMRQFYRYKYQNHFFNEPAIFSTLTVFLRQELQLFAARSLISKVELFRYFPKTLVAQIIENSKVTIFLPNDIIAKPGNPVHFVYFISSGTVACLSENAVEVAHLEDGSDMGLVGALPSVPSPKFHFYYIAIEPTLVYAIGVKEFKSFMYVNNDLVKYFERKLFDRAEQFHKREMQIKFQAYDLLTELSSGRILEKPRYRTMHYE